MTTLTLLVLAAVLYTAQGFTLPNGDEESYYASCEMSTVNLSDDEIDKLLSVHNEKRAMDSAESGKAIPAMTWNDQLAQRAQAWADYLAKTQSFDHGYLETCEGKRMGQNLWQAGTTGNNLKPVTEAVHSWYKEKSDYDYESNKCNPKKMCGHYTQIVWANSLEVGCAKSIYKQGSWNYIVVACDYFPPGNYRGQRPY